MSSPQNLSSALVKTLVAADQRRRVIRLQNDQEYTILVDEAAKRSTFFEAMFREGSQFAEARDDSKDAVIDVKIPDCNAFDSIYVFLMTGTQCCVRCWQLFDANN